MTQDIDVLVVGAGPTGLMMAAELARYGLTCRIIDKAKAPSDKSKALAIQARTLEIFHHLGIVDDFLKEGIKIHGGNAICKGEKLAHFSFEHIASPYPFVLSLEQSKTENILFQYLSGLGVQVERELELVSLNEHKDHIEATLFHSAKGQKETISTSWVIGCDGCHSAVRKSMGLSFEGSTFSDIFSIADVHIKWRFSHDEFFTFLDAEGIIAAIPIPGDNRYRLVFQLKRCKDLLKRSQITLHGPISSHVIADPTVTEVEDLIHRHADPHAVISDPVWLTNFSINSRLSTCFKKGRVFLAGDAAHIHSPAGGQGMNTGIQDAFNLGWKLAFVHHNQASIKLLDTYHIERHSVAKTLLEATKMMSNIGTLKNRVLIYLRNHVLRLITKSVCIEKHLTTALSQIGIKYPSSFIVRDSKAFKEGPKAGTRVPNIALMYKDKMTDLYAVMKRKSCYYLLLFSGYKNHQNNIDKLIELAAKYLTYYGSLIQPLLILREPMSKLSTTKILELQDIEDKAHHLFGALDTVIYLIRPDICIEYRQTPLSESELDKHLNYLSIIKGQENKVLSH